MESQYRVMESQDSVTESEDSDIEAQALTVRKRKKYDESFTGSEDSDLEAQALTIRKRKKICAPSVRKRNRPTPLIESEDSEMETTAPTARKSRKLMKPEDSLRNFDTAHIPTARKRKTVDECHKDSDNSDIETQVPTVSERKTYRASWMKGHRVKQNNSKPDPPVQHLIDSIENDNLMDAIENERNEGSTLHASDLVVPPCNVPIFESTSSDDTDLINEAPLIPVTEDLEHVWSLIDNHESIWSEPELSECEMPEEKTTLCDKLREWKLSFDCMIP